MSSRSVLMFRSVNGTVQSYGRPEHLTPVVRPSCRYREVMPDPHVATERAESRARTGAIGAIVAAFAFFDGVFVGAPIALLAASLRPLLVFVAAVIAVTCLSIACSGWLNRR